MLEWYARMLGCDDLRRYVLSYAYPCSVRVGDIVTHGSERLLVQEVVRASSYYPPDTFRALCVSARGSRYLYDSPRWPRIRIVHAM